VCALAEEARLSGYEKLHLELTRKLAKLEDDKTIMTKDFGDLLSTPIALQLICDVLGISVVVYHPKGASHVCRPLSFQPQYEPFVKAYELCVYKNRGALQIAVGQRVAKRDKPTPPPSPPQKDPEVAVEKYEVWYEEKSYFVDAPTKTVADILLWARERFPSRASCSTCVLKKDDETKLVLPFFETLLRIPYRVIIHDHGCLGTVKPDRDGYWVRQRGAAEHVSGERVLEKAKLFSTFARRFEYMDGARWKPPGYGPKRLLLSRGQDAIMSTSNCVLVCDGVSRSDHPSVPNGVQVV
jgi:hypothetical protein